MSEWDCVAGGTLLIPTGNENHLYIILNDPADFEGYIPKSCFSVNITSIKDGIPYDDSCVLKAGCHPFVKHDSYIAYRHARLDSANNLKKLVDAGKFYPHEPLEKELFDSVLQGLKGSLHTPRYIKLLI